MRFVSSFQIQIVRKTEPLFLEVMVAGMQTYHTNVTLITFLWFVTYSY